MKVAVVGGGTMGSGIAQVCATSGMQVSLIDVDHKVIEAAKVKINSFVSKLIEKKRIAGDRDEIARRLTYSNDLASLSGAELVIEAIYENYEAKKRLFIEIDKLITGETIVASNTSAIPITRLAATVSRPENVIGLHFFNPVPLLNAVEVVRGISTSDKVFEYGASFVRLLGKEPIMVKRDLAGFILNRINMLTNMEAYRLVEEGVASPEDIDKGVKLAFGRKMGPFETSDIVGLEVQLMAYTNVYEEEKDTRFYPPSILRRKVLAGHLGVKAGRGWYEYNEDGTRKKSC